jgi:hypothetical protein
MDKSEERVRDSKRILLGLQNTTTLTKIRDPREEQGKKERNKRSMVNSPSGDTTVKGSALNSDLSLRTVDSDDDSDGHVETALNKSSQ